MSSAGSPGIGGWFHWLHTMPRVGRGLLLALAAVLMLSLLVGLFPRAFFVLYAGAGALFLLGVGLVMLPFGTSGIRRGLLLLALSPLFFIYTLVVQAVYDAVRGVGLRGTSPVALIQSLGVDEVLGIPVGAWGALAFGAANAVGITRGLTRRQLAALNLWLATAGIAAIYLLIRA